MSRKPRQFCGTMKRNFTGDMDMFKQAIATQMSSENSLTNNPRDRSPQEYQKIVDKLKREGRFPSALKLSQRWTENWTRSAPSGSKNKHSASVGQPQTRRSPVLFMEPALRMKICSSRRGHSSRAYHCKKIPSHL